MFKCSEPNSKISKKIYFRLIVVAVRSFLCFFFIIIEGGTDAKAKKKDRKGSRNKDEREYKVPFHTQKNHLNEIFEICSNVFFSEYLSVDRFIVSFYLTVFVG